MSFIRTTEPPIEPVSLTDMKTHLRITAFDENDDISGLITLARQHIEEICSISIIQQTWDYFLDSFPLHNSAAIRLPRPPLVSVTYVKYLDDNGDLQTWSDTLYTVDTAKVLGTVIPSYAEIYPSTQRFQNAVQIRFIAGYADGSAVPFVDTGIPKPLIHALKLLVGHWYENREATVMSVEISNVPLTIRTLLDTYKVYWRL